MNSPVVTDPKPVTAVSAALDSSDALALSLYTLIAKQPFFKGLNSQQLQQLAASALEMKFETGATIFMEGSPANRFYLMQYIDKNLPEQPSRA